MRIMAIIGIILFTWLFIKRTDQYKMTRKATGATITYSEAAIEKMQSHVIQQTLVSVYGIIFAVVVLVRGSRRSRADEAKDMTLLSELREKGLVNDVEFEAAKNKITGL